MRVTEVGITLSKMKSDNNYGHERAEVHMSASLDPHDDPADCLQALLFLGRTRVYADLSSSRSSAIRAGLDEQVAAAVGGDEDEPF